jgi:hypothetical protein
VGCVLQNFSLKQSPSQNCKNVSESLTNRKPLLQMQPVSGSDSSVRKAPSFVGHMAHLALSACLSAGTCQPVYGSQHKSILKVYTCLKAVYGKSCTVTVIGKCMCTVSSVSGIDGW